jgi:hypothetical protein
MKISQLPKEIKEVALEYQHCSDYSMNEYSDNLIDAFAWSRTPYGYDYWNILEIESLEEHLIRTNQ